MSIRNLAEAIILQSVEDLYDKKQKRNCLTFFKGEGFCICAGLAGLKVSERKKLLKLIKTSMKQVKIPITEMKRRMCLEYSAGRG
jgi:hypothetical protein